MTRSTALNPKVILLIAEMEMTNILCKRANENPDIQKKKKQTDKPKNNSAAGSMQV